MHTALKMSVRLVLQSTLRKFFDIQIQGYLQFFVLRDILQSNIFISNGR